MGVRVTDALNWTGLASACAEEGVLGRCPHERVVLRVTVRLFPFFPLSFLSLEDWWDVEMFFVVVCGDAVALPWRVPF